MARVLMIDDDDLLTELVATRLEADGHQVIALDRGEGVDAALAAARPDLVILDQHLPGIAGIDVLARLRADPRLHSLPVMMLTGDRGEALLARAHDGGADDYLRKPIDLDELADRADAMLRGGALARAAGKVVR